MTWTTAFVIAFSVCAGNLLFGLYDRWRAKLNKRVEIPAYRNWRGVYVPDLHLIRAKRAGIAAYIIGFIVIMALSYFFLTHLPPDLVRSTH
ncbi:hypothetical protein [Sphingomonas beigongshangi]|uniref:hypothetical protein n=1 Tax=Sphingomonas beigongshangi TaxID=2782540 RepID=UPI00193C6C77|nr:hypothetical protein [Sphingomonas beigongshangi]